MKHVTSILKLSVEGENISDHRNATIDKYIYSDSKPDINGIK